MAQCAKQPDASGATAEPRADTGSTSRRKVSGWWDGVTSAGAG